jgi:hypothetical protein
MNIDSLKMTVILRDDICDGFAHSHPIQLLSLINLAMFSLSYFALNHQYDWLTVALHLFRPSCYF